MKSGAIAVGVLLAAVLCACSGSKNKAQGAAGSGGAAGNAAGGGSGTSAADASTAGAAGTAGTAGTSADAAAAGSSGIGTGSGSAGGVGKNGCQVKPLFPAAMAWNKDISKTAKDAQSDKIIAALQQRGWGAGRMQIDYSIDVLCADDKAPFRAFDKTDNFFAGECDDQKVPVPAGGHVEGYSDYNCAKGGDCHLIVIHGPTHKLYEQWVASIDGNDHYTGGCLAVWDLNKSYPDTLRGDQCSSADAAGLPIAPLLFDADEVAAGEIKHAIRFALPNTHLAQAVYVRPATHATRAASAGDDGVPYGARLRLRADFPLASLPSDGARVVAKAMQKYGMIMADGGNIALMGQADNSTQHKWNGLLDTHDLAAIKPSDFELVEAGMRFTWNGNCTLSP